MLARWNNSIASGEPFDMTFPLRGADGHFRSFLTRAMPLKDEAGRVLQWFGTNTDVSEQLRAEEALRASEEKFSTAFGNNPAAIALSRLDDGEVLDVNETWLMLMGFRREEVIGKKASQHNMWPDSEGRARYVRRLRETGLVRGYEEWFRKRSGELFAVQLSGQVLNVGGVQVLLSTLVDVTERRRAEEKFAAAFSNNPTAIALIRLEDGVYLDVNTAWEKLNGYSREEVIGKSAREISLAMTPEVRMQYVEELVKTGSMHWPEERFVKKSGEVYVGETTAQILTIGGDKVILTTLVDITDRKARELLKIENVQLEAENRRIQEATKMKTEFLANMSHELRTPLNGIIGFAELLLDQIPGPLNAKQLEYLGDVYDSGRHLLQLINDILDLSKVEAGKMDLHITRFPFPRAAGEVCAVIKAMAQKLQVTVETSIAPELRIVALDEQRLKQVLYNLPLERDQVQPHEWAGSVARGAGGGWRELRDPCRRQWDRDQAGESLDALQGVPANRLGPLAPIRRHRPGAGADAAHCAAARGDDQRE